MIDEPEFEPRTVRTGASCEGERSGARMCPWSSSVHLPMEHDECMMWRRCLQPSNLRDRLEAFASAYGLMHRPPDGPLGHRAPEYPGAAIDAAGRSDRARRGPCSSSVGANW
jgi:hypothetical protein